MGKQSLQHGRIAQGTSRRIVGCTLMERLQASQFFMLTDTFNMCHPSWIFRTFDDPEARSAADLLLGALQDALT
jgi:hypothetical protein